MNVTVNRILVVHSFRDEGFALRLQQIANNPYLEAFQLEHICIIDDARESALVPEYYRQQAEKRGTFNISSDINEDLVSPYFLRQIEESKDLSDILLRIINEEVEPLLHRKIENFDPDIVILHGGTIFNEAPEAFIGMISRLMSRYPRLMFALEGKERWKEEWCNKSFYRRTALAFERLGKAFGWKTPHPTSVLEFVLRYFVSDPTIDEIVEAIFGPGG